MRPKQTAMWLGLETQAQRAPARCDAYDINGCTKPGAIKLTGRGGRVDGVCCSRKCCNELASELSEGTWCPYPDEPEALTQEQMQENMTYFRD